MFFLDVFISNALAEAQAADVASGSPFLSLVPLAVIFVIFFFLVIRPQHKRIKLHNQMIASLKKGDKVLSSSGIMGIITKIDDSSSVINLEIAKGVEVKITKTSIADKIEDFDLVKEKPAKHSKSTESKADDLALNSAEVREGKND